MTPAMMDKQVKELRRQSGTRSLRSIIYCVRKAKESNDNRWWLASYAWCTARAIVEIGGYGYS